MSFLTLLGLAGGQFAAIAHQMLVKHVKCAEHGELIDVPRSQDFVVHTRHELSALRHTGVAQGAGPHEGSHEHDHCIVALTSQQQLLKVAHLQPVPHLVYVAVRAEFRSLATLNGVYRLAPKTSPPV